MTENPTPPGDDVLEAVDRAVRVASPSPLGVDYVPWWKVAHAVRDSLLAEPTLEVRPRGTVTPTVEEWAEQMDAERARQIEHGYDDAHDAEHGAAHLLNWAIDYARRGNNLAAATMARCALRLPRGTVTDAEVEAAAGAICQAAEGEPITDIRMGMREQYKREARAALEAAREVRNAAR